MRFLMAFLISCFALVSLATLRADDPPRAAQPEGSVTLLGTLEEWKYPDAKIPEGATMSDGGVPDVSSIKCQTVLTTADSFEKVVDFYANKFDQSVAKAEGVPHEDAKSVVIQDDSTKRPVKVQVILVNKAKTSTTLVISRAEGEKETHIAWAHYMRFDIKR